MTAAKKPPRCGHCRTADAVRHGTVLKRQLKDGSVFTYSTEAALAHLASMCRCPDRADGAPADPETVGRIPVPELRREGQRILRPGVLVSVQIKKRAGTKVRRGHVVECYADGTVKVWLDCLRTTTTVDADEWLKARRGSVSPMRLLETSR